MAIKYESALKWGDIFYIKTDPDQVEYALKNILLSPGKPQYVLRHGGWDEVTVYECETARVPDMNKKLNIERQNETEQDNDDQNDEE